MNNDIRKLIDDNWEDVKEYIVEKLEAGQKPKTIWDLDIRDSERYHYINFNGDIYSSYFNDIFDKHIRIIGNAFLTKEEAEFELERRKVEAIIRRYSRPFKLNESNYVIKHNAKFKTVEIGFFSTADCGIPYFESEEIAIKVINEIGEERLIKYWFGITE